jgi:hypothetical protein
MWGAAHPPAPSSAVAQGFGPGQTREYIEQTHLANRSKSTVQNYKLTIHIPLFGGPDTNISDEYFAYKQMADRCGITDVRYVSQRAQTQKKYYVAPCGCAGENIPLKEWSTMSERAFSNVTNGKAQCDRITYLPKLYTRTCQPIPFSIRHCFVSSYNTEQRHAEEINKIFPVNRKFALKTYRWSLLQGLSLKSKEKRRAHT